MLRGLQTSAVVLIVAGALTAPAAGQPAAPPRKSPTPQELDRAREYFKAAEAAKRRHEYKDAADSYLGAYALFPDPEFYFDVAEVYRLGGDEAGALTYYRKYLDLEPAGRGSATARAAIIELRRALEAKKAGGPAKPSDRPATATAPNSSRPPTAPASGGDRSPTGATTSRSERPATTLPPGSERPPIAATTSSTRPPADTAMPRGGEPPTVTVPHSEPAPLPATAAATTPAPGAPGRTFRLAGLAAGGAGVITLAIGVGFGIHAKSISDEASRWDTFHQARYDEGQAAQRNMYILTGVGAATLVAGGVLYYLGVRADATAERGAVAVVPALGAGTVGLTAAGVF